MKEFIQAIILCAFNFVYSKSEQGEDYSRASQFTVYLITAIFCISLGAVSIIIFGMTSTHVNVFRGLPLLSRTLIYLTSISIIYLITNHSLDKGQFAVDLYLKNINIDYWFLKSKWIFGIGLMVYFVLIAFIALQFYDAEVGIGSKYE